jgi:transglutaminase-like putative cysteine protease
MTTALSRSPASASPSSGAPSTLAPRGGIVGPSVATGVAVVLASLSLAPLVDSAGWFGPTVLAVLVVTLVGALATWLRVPVFLIPIMQALLLFAVLVAKFTTNAPWGFIPSSDSLTSLRGVLADGMASVDQFAPPVPLSDGIASIMTLGVGCVAIVVFVLAVDLRMPVAAGAGLVAIYVVPSFVLDEGSPWWAFTAVAIGWMVLLISDERVGLVTWGRLLRRADSSGPQSPLAGLSSAALRLGAVSLVAAVLLPILVPSLADAVMGRTGAGSGTDAGGGSGGRTVGLDPFADLKRTLISQSDTPVLHYTTSADIPTYLPTVVLEDYADEKWRARVFSTEGATQVGDGVDVAASSLLRSGKAEQYRFTVDGLANKFLPVPEGLTTVTGLQGSWFSDPTTGTIFATQGATTTGQAWTADAVTIPAARDVVAAPSTGASDAEQKRILAQGIPPFLVDTAKQWTSGETTDVGRAFAIQQKFLEFTYSVDVTSDQRTSYLQQFMDDKKGYCQQFAATMALMARSLGIPARVVVGYTQGTRDANGGWTVLSRDAHAWPELSFPGVGWVRFEPTPRTDGTVVPQPRPTTAVSTPPTTSPGASASPSRGGKLDNLTEKENPGDVPAFNGPDSSAGTTADQWRLRGILLLILVGLAGGAVPAVRRGLRRRRRLGADASVEDAWDELRDTARDLGVPWSDALTPRQAVASVIDKQRLRGTVAEAATRVGRTTERSRYAATPPPTEGLVEDVSTVRTALLERTDRGTRVRAILLPASLRRPQG